jgi:tRNA pseudouridine55 synthase
LICLGRAARVSEYLMELPKTYHGLVRLGTATDTYDATGTTVSEGDPSTIDEAALREALDLLSRQDVQVPPSYSAVKIRGTPAHRLARSGRPVALRPRNVRIDGIEILSFERPLVQLVVRCGKGTYIRTLANDLGRLLGCGAHLATLRRTRVGPFAVDDSITLDRLEAAFVEDSWRDLLLPMDYGLGQFPAVYLDTDSETDIRHGRHVAAELPPFERLQDAADGIRCRAYAEDGTFIGILQHDSSNHRWRPQKLLISGLPRP